MMADIRVKDAVYGAVSKDSTRKCQSMDASTALQKAIDANQGIVRIDNQNLGFDPSPGNWKHLIAVVNRDDGNYYFACKEGQTVDFNSGGKPST
ncbi:MAG: hypothetical protein RIC95_10130 [Vicingaceae bacterium]